jgi:hypothetical protein
MGGAVSTLFYAGPPKEVRSRDEAPVSTFVRFQEQVIPPSLVDDTPDEEDTGLF